MNNMFDDLKVVSTKSIKSKPIKSNSFDVSFAFKNIKRTLIAINISPAKLKELQWTEDKKILIYSDGKSRFGLLPDVTDRRGYSLRKRVSKNNVILGYTVLFSWNESICEKMEDIILTDRSLVSGKILATQIIENGLLISIH